MWERLIGKQVGLRSADSVKWETQRAIFVVLQEKNIEHWMFRKETKWPCKQEVESFDEELWQMTAIPAAFICCKACDIVAEDAFSVASQHSIGLIDIKWSTFMRQQSRYVIWYVWKIPSLFPWEIPAFWNILYFLENSRQDTSRGKLRVCGKD